MFADQIKVARLNVATAEKLASHYRIRAVPTLLLFHQGQVLERVIGSIPKPDLVSKLNPLLAGNSSCGSRVACL
jgi:thioredoxin 1